MKTLKQQVKEYNENKPNKRYVNKNLEVYNLGVKLIRLIDELENASPYDQQNILETEFELEL